jgi:hypothetical protein
MYTSDMYTSKTPSLRQKGDTNGTVRVPKGWQPRAVQNDSVAPTGNGSRRRCRTNGSVALGRVLITGWMRLRLSAGSMPNLIGAVRLGFSGPPSRQRLACSSHSSSLKAWSQKPQTHRGRGRWRHRVPTSIDTRANTHTTTAATEHAPMDGCGRAMAPPPRGYSRTTGCRRRARARRRARPSTARCRVKPAGLTQNSQVDPAV